MDKTLKHWLLVLGLLGGVVTTDIAQAVDVQISQLTDSPDPAIRAGQITYSVSLLNSNNDTASAVTLTFPLPATTTFDSVNDANCAHDGGSPGTVNCAFGDITGDGLGGPITTVDIVLNTTAATGNTLNVTGTVATASVDSDPLNNSLGQNTTIDDGADLSLTITDSPDPAVAGGTIDYTLGVTNLGPNDAATTTVVNTLPPDVTFVSAVGAGWSCSAVGQDVTCIRSSISNGSSAPDIVITGRVTGMITGNITDSATVSSATGDPAPSNNTTTEDTFIQAGTDLALTKSVSPDPVIAGSTATFTLQPRNNGPFAATSVTVTDNLPGGFAFVSAVGPGWACAEVAGTVTCTRSTLAIGATDDIVITTTAPAGAGAYSNTATIAAAETDAVPANNSDTVGGNSVPDGADLSINKSKSPNPVAAGSAITSTIAVTNNGPAATSGTLTVTDTLDPGETFVSTSGTNWTCGHAAGVVTCTYSATPLIAGATTANLTITTTATATGSLTNNASVSDVGGTMDGVPGNNATSGTTTSTGMIADLSIAKSATTADANTTLATTENDFTYTLVVTNNGPDAVDAVTVTDDIPGFVSGVTGAVPATTGVSVVDDSGGQFTCSTGATVTCNLNGGQTLSNAEVVTFTITASRPFDDGALTNTARVSSTSLGDDDPSNNTSSVGVTVDPIADVEVRSKTVTPGTTEAGTEATYVITVANNGPSEAANVLVQDIFAPPGVKTYTFISATPSTGSCDPFETSAANTLDCDLGTLARDEAQTVTVVIRPDWDVANDSWVLPNTVTVSTTTTESNAGNNSDTASLNVTPAEIDLLVNKTDLQDPVAFDPTNLPSNVIIYRVDMTNRGPSLATGVNLADAFTPKTGKQLTFQCDDAGAGGCAVGTSLCNNLGVSVTGPATLNLTCPISDLPANTTVSRYLYFLVDTAPDAAGDTHNNQATVSANEDDLIPGNDTEAESTSVRVAVDLGITKSDSADPVSINEPYTYTLNVNNNGPGDSEQSTVTDNLPTGMELTATPMPTTGSCTGAAGSTAFTCNLGAINNGGNASITVPVRITSFPAGGTISNTASISSFGVDIVPGNNSATEPTSVIVSSIAGTSFQDPGDDGSQDVGDTGIAGVTMTLTGTDLFGNPVMRVVMTDGSGDYVFDNLPPSDGTGYSITETQPAGLGDGLENAGDPGGTNIVPGSRLTDTISGVVLAANTDLTGYDFANIADTSIQGNVYVDQNNNGTRDGGEVGIENVAINLSGTDDFSAPVNLNTTTDANGAYQFTGLRPGNYVITETQPAAWGDGAESLGSAGGTVGADTFSAINLPLNVMAMNYDFGEIGNSLSGFVYTDTDGDGVNDPSEVGIPGVTITLTGTDLNGDPVNIMVTTGPDGSYRFDNLPQPNGAGYTITETQPAGVADGVETLGSAGGTVGADTFTGITFPAPGTNATGYNFGEGSIVNPGRISGRVYFDGNHNRTDDETSGQDGWTVQLVQRTDPLDFDNVTVIASVITDANGDYSFEGLSPGSYEIFFLHPDGGTLYGTPQSGGGAGSTDNGTIRGINIVGGSDVMAQDLPLDPAGVIYDSVTREPVSGATITINGPAGFNPAIHLVGGANNLTQVTGPSGQYQYLLLSTAPVGVYTLAVTSPANYVPGVSTMIPACTNTLTVGPVPNPALVQNLATAPGAAATTHNPNTCASNSAAGAFATGGSSTQYYLSFNLNPGLGGSADLINNHIPVDPIIDGALTVVKTTSVVNVSRGDFVPYSLRVSNNIASSISNLDVSDQLPPGFKYRSGSASVDGVSVEPIVNGRELRFEDLSFAGNQQRLINLVALVGSGVAEGTYTNQAWARSRTTGQAISNVATAAVRVVPDAALDCAEVIGKVFDDENQNGLQDENELGVANVRVATVRGLLTTTDEHGRFHIACVQIPDEERGSNFIMKLDVRSLPSGYQVTTENPRVIRLTRGKLSKLNFGVSLDPTVESGANAEGSIPINLCEQNNTSALCLDSRLKESDIQLRYDSLEQTPWLNIHASPNAAQIGQPVTFSTYSNYLAWIDKTEVLIYEQLPAPQTKAIETLPVDSSGTVGWSVPNNENDDAFYYVLRVYDKDGRFDQTAPKRLALSRAPAFNPKRDEQDAVYGENARDIANIPIKGGAVTVNGKGLEPGTKVALLGQAVPVDKEGKFAVRQILPHGPHDVALSVATQDGEVVTVERQINIAADDWFYVALADFTTGRNSPTGALQEVTGNDGDRYEREIYVDGRLAFYLKGKIKGEYLLTAAADTQEQPLEDMFSNLTRKDPRTLLRRLDADQYYPVYGDDSTTIQDAPTQGKFYIRVERGESQVMWGNFHTRIQDSELVRYNRGLYGARVKLADERLTDFDEQRGALEYFAADPGSLPARDEFRGTGGSLYYLQRQDITQGSERLWIEIRDKDTGLVLETRYLAPFEDYDVNYLQGRVLLTNALASTAVDNRIVQNDSLAGHTQVLVATYEYTPGIGNVDDLVTGGRGTYWLGNHIRIGLSNYRQEAPGAKQDLYGGDIILRWTDESYLKFEAARSEGPGSGNRGSIDGGFLFNSQVGTDAEADAFHLEGNLSFVDLGISENGGLSFYWQDRDAGYSGPGQIAGNASAQRKGVDAQWQPFKGADVGLSVSQAKGQGIKYFSAEVDYLQRVSEQWSVGIGLRNDDRDTRVASASPTLNREGSRTDLALRFEYLPAAVNKYDWSAYSFIQGTLARNGDRKANDRVGLGGDIRVSDRLKLNAEVSTGKRGVGAVVGGEFQRTETTNHYLNYALNPDRTDIGYRGRQGQLTAGTRMRFSEKGSVFGEHQLQHGDGPSGLIRSFGLDFAPTDEWSFSARAEFGQISDPLSGDLKRRAAGGTVGFYKDQLSFSTNLEYRDESGSAGDRDTWLIRNNLSYELNDDWRLLGKLNASVSDAAGDFLDGEFAESTLGFAFRPVAHDEFNMLFRYRFFYDLPSPGQLTDFDVIPNYAQRSHIVSADATWDIWPRLSIGGKVAWKRGEFRNSRTSGPWLDSNTLLGVGRLDLHITNEWDAVLEGRILDIDEAQDRRSGFLFGVYRHVGRNFKVGVGYNFTDFSDDLTDLDYDNDGVFFNFIGKY